MSDLPLKQRLARIIQADGPMPVSAYMQACLHDPKHGYYATRPGLGTDFTTAPETSQVFGELLGLWAVNQWRAFGAPKAFTLAELGPGRGTLMGDALRAAARADSTFREAMRLYLIEASPTLRARQAEHLAAYAPAHVSGLPQLPDAPAIILANEYLDCLPTRQFVRVSAAWHERVVGLGPNDDLTFGLAADAASAAPTDTAGAQSVEVQPGLELLIRQLQDTPFGKHPFYALFADYGPANTAPTDTLRAYSRGQQVHPLATPGEADLTVDVDFGRLKRLAETAGLTVHGPAEQGPFLLSLGAEQRMQALIKARPQDADNIYESVRKLVDPAEMGARFKMMCISSPGLPPPAGF